MKIDVRLQESYSRGELLLRTFFGMFYIIIPHAFCLLFLGIANMFVKLIAFWAILITGKMPRGIFDFQLNMARWGLRLNARMLNLSDGYPAIGLNKTDNNTIIDIEYPETISRGSMLLRAFFGAFYVYLPHIFCLVFVSLGVGIVSFINFWVILITGKHIPALHGYLTGLLRWGIRINLYLSYLTQEYPPFSLKGNENDWTV